VTCCRRHAFVTVSADADALQRILSERDVRALLIDLNVLPTPQRALEVKMHVDGASADCAEM
jgi:hypothetical protein